MRAIIKIESKRIVKSVTTLVFFVAILLLSMVRGNIQSILKVICLIPDT